MVDGGKGGKVERGKGVKTMDKVSVVGGREGGIGGEQLCCGVGLVFLLCLLLAAGWLASWLIGGLLGLLVLSCCKFARSLSVWLSGCGFISYVGVLILHPPALGFSLTSLLYFAPCFRASFRSVWLSDYGFISYVGILIFTCQHWVSHLRLCYALPLSSMLLSGLSVSLWILAGVALSYVCQSVNLLSVLELSYRIPAALIAGCRGVLICISISSGDLRQLPIHPRSFLDDTGPARGPPFFP